VLSAYRARIEKLDHAAMFAIARRRRRALNAILGVLTWTGHGVAWALAVATLVLGSRYDLLRFPQREAALHSTLAAGIAWVASKLIKTAARRRRPFQVLESLPRLTSAPNDDSFPSAHAASVFAFLTAMTPLGPAVVTPIAMWAVLVSFSRYYLGVHFPSDIFAGALIGTISGAALLIVG
jgi:undecaprenyl-diphosphatase